LKNKVPIFKPKNGWRTFRVCKNCMSLVKEGEKCKTCGKIWEKDF